MRLSFVCGRHGEQGLKDVLMMSAGGGTLLELRCACVYKIWRDRGGVLRQRRLAFRQAQKLSDAADRCARVGANQA